MAKDKVFIFLPGAHLKSLEKSGDLDIEVLTSYEEYKFYAEHNKGHYYVLTYGSSTYPERYPEPLARVMASKTDTAFTLVHAVTNESLWAPVGTLPYMGKPELLYYLSVMRREPIPPKKNGRGTITIFVGRIEGLYAGASYVGMFRSILLDAYVYRRSKRSGLDRIDMLESDWLLINPKGRILFYGPKNKKAEKVLSDILKSLDSDQKEYLGAYSYEFFK